MARPKDAFIPRNSSLSPTPVRINDPDRLKANPSKVVKEAVRKSINTLERNTYLTSTGIVLRVEEVSRPASMGPYSDSRLVNKYFEGEEKFYVLITRMFDYSHHIPYDPTELFKKNFARKTLTQRLETKVYATSSDFTDGIPQPGDYITAEFLDIRRGVGAVYRGTIAFNTNVDAEDGDSTEPCDNVRQTLERLLDSNSQPVVAQEAEPDPEPQPVPEPQTESEYAETYQRPIDDIVTSNFGMRDGRMHFGTDLRAAVGTAIRAPYDGVIRNVNFTNQTDANGDAGAGYVVWLDTEPLQNSTEWDTTLRMKFFHLSRPGTVQAGYPLPEGTPVSKGDIFAYSGDTNGLPSGGDPHLHWEVYRNGVRINPMTIPGVEN